MILEDGVSLILWMSISTRRASISLPHFVSWSFVFCMVLSNGEMRLVQTSPLRITALAVSESLVISFLRPMDKGLCQSSFVVCPRCRVIRVKPGSWHLIRNDSFSMVRGPDPEIPAAGRMDSSFV